MAMQSFINQNAGKTHLTPDPSHGIDGECVNLGSSWSLANDGPELVGTTAWLIWLNFRHPFFQVIPNTPTNQPSPGDLVFFAPNVHSIGTGYAGHVDLAVDQITTVGFRGFDANWTKREAEYVNHPYAGVVGWFHFNQGASMADAQIIKEREDLRTLYYQEKSRADQAEKEREDLRRLYYEQLERANTLEARVAALENKPAPEPVPPVVPAEGEQQAFYTVLFNTIKNFFKK